MSPIIRLGGTAAEPTLKITKENDMNNKTFLPNLTPNLRRIICRHFGTHWKIIVDGEYVCTFADSEFAIRLMMLTAKEISAVSGAPKMDIEASHAKILQVKRIATAKRETLIRINR